MNRRFNGGRAFARLPRARDAQRFMRELRGPVRWTALRSALDAVVVTAALKRRGLRSIRVEPRRVPTRVDPDRARALAIAVDAAFGVLPLAPTCLRRSVVLKRELSRQNIDSSLHIGVRNVDGNVEAHAWIQAGDEVINDDPDLIRTYAEIAVGDLDRLMPAMS